MLYKAIHALILRIFLTGNIPKSSYTKFQSCTTLKTSLTENIPEIDYIRFQRYTHFGNISDREYT